MVTTSCLTRLSSLKIDDDEWPAHMIAGRDAALKMVSYGLFNQGDRNTAVHLLPALRLPEEQWSVADAAAIHRLCHRLEIDVIDVFVYALLVVKWREKRNADVIAASKVVEPLGVNIVENGISYRVEVLPHPDLGLPIISSRDDDGYWSFSAGDVVWCKSRVSLGEGVRMWNELVNFARFPNAPVLTRGMLE